MNDPYEQSKESEKRSFHEAALDIRNRLALSGHKPREVRKRAVEVRKNHPRLARALEFVFGGAAISLLGFILYRRFSK